MIIKGKNEYIIHGDTMFFFFYLDDNIRRKLTELNVLQDGDSMTIKNGFKWNGANLLPDIDLSIKLSCIHDYLYDKSIIKEADILLKSMIESKIIEITPHMYVIYNDHGDQSSYGDNIATDFPKHIGSWIIYNILKVINKFRFGGKNDNKEVK